MHVGAWRVPLVPGTAESLVLGSLLRVTSAHYGQNTILKIFTGIRDGGKALKDGSLVKSVLFP